MAKTTPLAIPELEAVEVHGMSRGAFLARGALATGALLGGSAVGPFVRRAVAQETGGDVDILNFALTLEYIEAAFYSRAISKGRNMSAETMRLVARDPRQRDRARRRDHPDDQPPRRHAGAGPEGRLRRVFTSEKSFLKLAQTLEDTGVSAYNGAAPSIRSGDVLAAAGSIVQVEARHAALIRLMRGQTPAPAAFDPALDQHKVLDAVMPFARA